MLETRSLRHFVAVAQELHFGRAARRLNISQPPLSISIRQLEERMGTPLFIRTQRSVELTAAGRVLLDKALLILGELEDAVVSTQAAGKGYHGVLRIGYTAASAYKVVPEVIGAFHESYPLVELELLEMVSTEQVMALRQQRIDLGVLRPVPIKAPLRSLCLLREPLVLALPQSHPFGQSSRISLADCDGAPFIGFDLRHAPYFNGMVEEALRQARITPRFVQRATQTHAIVAMVAAGLGVALVPETCMRIHMENLTFRALAEPLETGAEVHLCWNRETESPLKSHFVETAQRALGTGDGELGQ
ncbi:transcriptional regulator, LysR family [Oryzisolibacter propanilivorax]|uniref:Transcriptional regulator, LysR family n=1 Tax=Oryzisolibacter propanilivorax TaxID=1527607 RepID=A0A1G9QIZ7_9BURK|nr:LysR family transcriptional regulator [Oryzisolibacter propanilivorax]SDM10265.1 transcriptional regulator, LysR family [Oryzisolibacter propanilivorax]